MTKRYLKDWAYSKIIDYQLTAKASTSYTAQGAVFALSERRSCARRFEVSPAGAVVALCILNLCEKMSKKMLTELSDYVNMFLACDAHVQCASGSVVEHLLAKEGAAGSIPVSRFFNAKKQHPKRVLFFALNEPNPGLEGSNSRLPARSLLLQSRVIHRMTATRLALFIKKNLKGCCFFVFIGRKPATK